MASKVRLTSAQIKSMIEVEMNASDGFAWPIHCGFHAAESMSRSFHTD